MPDGRKLHYACSGGVRRGQAVLVFHHGQPGAALLWDDLVEAARRHGWPVIMVSRPGYASSDRRRGRRIRDAAGDVEHVLDHLGAGRFVTAGWSGGGPHALACAALAPTRCAAAATVAGVAPYRGVDDLDWTDGMGPENVTEFQAVMAGDPEVEARMAELMATLVGIQPDQLVEAFGGLVSEPDRAAIESGFGEYFAAWMRMSASGGPYGYVDDARAFIDLWGFDVASMAVPVAVWRATHDLMVPPAHGEWLTGHIPGATGILRPDEGHISLLSRHVAEIVDGLAEIAGEL